MCPKLFETQNFDAVALTCRMLVSFISKLFVLLHASKLLLAQICNCAKHNKQARHRQVLCLVYDNSKRRKRGYLLLLKRGCLINLMTINFTYDLQPLIS